MTNTKTEVKAECKGREDQGWLLRRSGVWAYLWRLRRICQFGRSKGSIEGQRRNNTVAGGGANYGKSWRTNNGQMALGDQGLCVYVGGGLHKKNGGERLGHMEEGWEFHAVCSLILQAAGVCCWFLRTGNPIFEDLGSDVMDIVDGEELDVYFHGACYVIYLHFSSIYDEAPEGWHGNSHVLCWQHPSSAAWRASPTALQRTFTLYLFTSDSCPKLRLQSFVTCAANLRGFHERNEPCKVLQSRVAR